MMSAVRYTTGTISTNSIRFAETMAIADRSNGTYVTSGCTRRLELGRDPACAAFVQNASAAAPQRMSDTSTGHTISHSMRGLNRLRTARNRDLPMLTMAAMLTFARPILLWDNAP